MSGNTLGKLFCVTSFGESHGPAIGCVVDGCPPGMELSAEDIQQDLDRRKPGTSRHVTQRGTRYGRNPFRRVRGQTTGTPIALLIRNEDQRSKDYSKIMDTFRPGHAIMSTGRNMGYVIIEGADALRAAKPQCGLRRRLSRENGYLQNMEW